ncbi:MAG: hypothetical protein WC205_07100 [Opitutaceae bacterium]|jgi:hypothetical protein
MKKNIWVLMVFVVSAFSLKAETLALFDSTLSVVGAPGGAQILSARWGIWNGSIFIEAVNSSANVGYLELSPAELSVSLSQTDNTIYASNTVLALAIFTNGSADAQALNWGGTVTNAVILTDTSWVTPSFTNSGNVTSFSFTANTTAVMGSYSFNGGSQILTLSAVPEPTAFAALFGMFTLGYACWYRRRVRHL